LTAYTGSGSAAGVSVQVMWGRPYAVINTSNGYTPMHGTTLATLDTGGATVPRPTAGQRIIFPDTEMIEDNIISAAPNGTTSAYTDVNIQNPAWKDVQGSSSAYWRMAVITTPIAYVVLASGELHHYQQQYNGTAVYWQDLGVLAR